MYFVKWNTSNKNLNDTHLLGPTATIFPMVFVRNSLHRNCKILNRRCAIVQSFIEVIWSPVFEVWRSIVMV
jgi:hypothetical protein